MSTVYFDIAIRIVNSWHLGIYAKEWAVFGRVRGAGHDQLSLRRHADASSERPYNMTVLSHRTEYSAGRVPAE